MPVIRIEVLEGTAQETKKHIREEVKQAVPDTLAPKETSPMCHGTSQDLSCTAANGQSLIRKALALRLEPRFLHLQHVVFPQNGRIAVVRCKCAGSGAIWRKQPFNERSNPRMLQTI